jgi:RNA polymerase sigma-70 factor (ECF subfamily)
MPLGLASLIRSKEISQMSISANSVKVDYASLSVTDLVVLSQRKDELALTELLKRHSVYIKNRLFKIAPDWADHSDLIQEIHIRIWRFIGQLRNPASFRTWLSQLITNVFYGELRKRPRDFHVVSLDEPFSNESSEDNSTRDIEDHAQKPEDVLLAKELTGVIHDAMAEVPLQFKTAQLLRDVEGLSYQEIAVITKSELGTVKSRIARARLRIQDRVSSYLADAA